MSIKEMIKIRKKFKYNDSLCKNMIVNCLIIRFNIECAVIFERPGYFPQCFWAQYKDDIRVMVYARIRQVHTEEEINNLKKDDVVSFSKYFENAVFDVFNVIQRELVQESEKMGIECTRTLYENFNKIDFSDKIVLDNVDGLVFCDEEIESIFYRLFDPIADQKNPSVMIKRFVSAVNESINACFENEQNNDCDSVKNEVEECRKNVHGDINRFLTGTNCHLREILFKVRRYLVDLYEGGYQWDQRATESSTDCLKLVFKMKHGDGLIAKIVLAANNDIYLEDEKGNRIRELWMRGWNIDLGEAIVIHVMSLILVKRQEMLQSEIIHCVRSRFDDLLKKQ